MAKNNERKLCSSSTYANYFSKRNSSEKTEIKDSPSKIHKYPSNANEAISILNKKASLQDLSKNFNSSNNNQKPILNYQVSFNPEDKIKMNLNNSSKEEKLNNKNNNNNNVININNNYDNTSESENYSPIGKLVSFQNIGGNRRTSNEELDIEKNQLNLNQNNYNKVNEKNGNENILRLQNNFDAEHPNESSSDENIEEKVNEYKEESNENDCIYCNN